MDRIMPSPPLWKRFATEEAAMRRRRMLEGSQAAPIPGAKQQMEHLERLRLEQKVHLRYVWIEVSPPDVISVRCVIPILCSGSWTRLRQTTNHWMMNTKVSQEMTNPWIPTALRG